ncbi:MAG TPA: glycosyltransferase family 2 protein [Jatrophihabitans sp.]|uniref:glycosyltransferase family 2 protein n=1 Tax=Jatrophihabitans sp. TaxID=1932789 RepID=UPI002E0A036D|nr:glycosyltransferase family 2 protein [Jatrophihabitans sp.]
MTPVTPQLDIVLPCLDEAGALPWVLDRIPPGARAVVVDNGSTDGSPDIARARGALVVTCDRRGYGAACHAGLEAATAEFVAFCDCDASLDPGDALRLLDGIRAGADLVVGRRRPVSRGAWSLHARVANVELARRVRRRTGADLRDVGPLRVARREPLLALPIADRRSGYPVETVLRAAQAGWTIVQEDVDYAPRTGRSKVTGTVRGTLQAVRDMSAVLAS